MTNDLYITLKNRSVLSIEGSDARTFLQGLITNDLNKVNEKNSIYALMLTPQGKFLYDFFIAEREGVLLLDCNSGKMPEIIKKLSMYKLRSDVQITDMSNIYEVCALVGEKVFEVVEENKAGFTRQFCKGIAYIDPRKTSIYARSIIEKENDYQSFKAFDFTAGVYGDYEQLRIKAGVPSGDEDMQSGSDFPHDFGMNGLNAIDYAKGCYVGQEVTARVHHKGSVRKSAYTIELASDNSNINFGDDVLAGDKIVGRVLSSASNLALALLSKEVVEKEKNNYTINGLEVEIYA